MRPLFRCFYLRGVANKYMQNYPATSVQIESSVIYEIGIPPASGGGFNVRLTRS
jgi:hypothetical protein